MNLSGFAKLVDVRDISPKNGGNKMTFAVLGFEEDFDRREVLVPVGLISDVAKCPIGSKVRVDLGVNKRFDGKEDVKLQAIKVAS